MKKLLKFTDNYIPKQGIFYFFIIVFTAFRISAFLGIEACSRERLYGMGVFSPAAIFTGALRYLNALSVTMALISEAIEPLRHASLTITSLPVFFTEFIKAFISRGTSVLGSMTSQSTPSLSSSPAASSDLRTIFE